MGQYTVAEKYLVYAGMNERIGGPGSLIPGVPRFVVPGAAASTFAFASTNHKFPYQDINSAYADCISGQGDVIVLYPGSHTLTANVAVAKNNVTIMGWEAWMGFNTVKPQAVITPLAATDGFTVTGTNFALIGVTCVPITAKNFLTYSAAANGLRIKDCYLDMVTPVVNIATKGFVATGAASFVKISGTRMVSGGAQGPALDLTGLIQSEVEDNRILNTLGSWAVGVQTGAGCLALLIKGNSFDSYGTAMTVGIDLTGADQVAGIEIEGNLFNSLVTGPVKNASGNTIANLTNNYKGTVGASSGGALVTAII